MRLVGQRGPLADTGSKNATEINKAMKLPVLGGLSKKESESLGALLSRCGGNSSAVPDSETCIHGSLLDDGTCPCLIVACHEISQNLMMHYTPLEFVSQTRR